MWQLVEDEIEASVDNSHLTPLLAEASAIARRRAAI